MFQKEFCIKDDSVTTFMNELFNELLLLEAKLFKFLSISTGISENRKQINVKWTLPTFY